MLEAVSSLVLAAHLLCMNLASAAPLLAAWLDRTARQRDDPRGHSAVRFLASGSVVAALAGATLGLVLGALRWSDAYRELLVRFSQRVHWGALEFLFSALLLSLYAIWVRRRPRTSGWGWMLRAGLAVLAATNLLYHFPPLFSMIAGTAAGTLDPGPVLDSAAFRRLLGEGEVLSLTTHFVLASFAVSGTALFAFKADTASPVGLADAPRQAVWGGRVALLATILQLPVGLWMIAQLPPAGQRHLMGGDPVSAGLLIAALLSVFWLLHVLAAAAWGDTSRPTARQAVLAMVIVVLLMVVVLQRTRPGSSSGAPGTRGGKNAAWRGFGSDDPRRRGRMHPACPRAVETVACGTAGPGRSQFIPSC